MIPPFIFMIYAQMKVNSAFKKYSRVRNMHGVTGAEVAGTLLRDNELDNVRLEQIKTRLGDHYDPETRCCDFLLRSIPHLQWQHWE